MTRLRLIGWSAMAVCVLGYAGFAATIIANKMGHLTLAQTALFGGGLAVVGEIGLWVGAGCLGLTLFKRRKAFFDRVFRRQPVDAGA